MWVKTTMRNIKAYFKPTSVEEAVQLLRDYPGKGICIAGGTRVAVAKDPSLDYLVDLTYCGLNYIQDQDGQLRLGACTTLEEITQSELVKRFATGILVEVARWLGSMQLRNSATLGGNIVSKDDLALPLIALDAQLVVVGKEQRTIPLTEFYLQTGNLLGKGEIIKTCLIPAEFRHAIGNALRLSRTRQDVSLVGVAVVLLIENEKCQKARLAVEPVISGIARVPQAEALLEGQTITENLISKVAETVVQTVQPIDDFRVSAAYRRQMFGVYTKRVLSKCLNK